MGSFFRICSTDSDRWQTDDYCAVDACLPAASSSTTPKPRPTTKRRLESMNRPFSELESSRGSRCRVGIAQRALSYFFFQNVSRERNSFAASTGNVFLFTRSVRQLPAPAPSPPRLPCGVVRLLVASPSLLSTPAHPTPHHSTTKGISMPARTVPSLR